MINNTQINKLNKNFNKNLFDNNLIRKLLDSNQININETFAGIILNKVIDFDTYEVYLYIKTDKEIVSPLKYSVIKDYKVAKKEYNKLKRLIENHTLDEIMKSIDTRD